MVAPSHQFLYPNGLPLSSGEAPTRSHNHMAFVGANTGFLPPNAFPTIPPPYDAWESAARELPSVCASDDWPTYVESLPSIPAEDLDDIHVLRANLYLGLIAHAVANVGQLPIPDTIMAPWRELGGRLERPTPSLIGHDMSIYNFDVVCNETDPPGAALPVLLLKDAWTQTRLHVTMTGTTTERNYLTCFMSIEMAARPLPGAICRAQQATFENDLAELRGALNQIIQILEEMTYAFQSGHPCPLSSRYIDHVEFTRCSSPISTAVVQGEKTFSGLLFPSIHLMDAFIARESFQTELGRLAAEERQWLPKLHREFLECVQAMSVYDYINELPEDEEKQSLMSLYRRLLSSFASEGGFLGKHRIRINAFIEIGMKVGRLATASGIPSPQWQKRTWQNVNEMLLSSMEERLSQYPQSFCESRVQESITYHVGDGNVRSITLRNPPYALFYRPGDHLAVLPENSPLEVSKTLDGLHIDGDHEILVRNPAWIRYLKERGEHIIAASQQHFAMTAREFFRFAVLQPLDQGFVDRFVEIMFITSPAMLFYLSAHPSAPVRHVMSMLEKVSPISFSHIIPRLDELFQPMNRVLYSIASHMGSSPEIVSLLVGKVEYKVPAFLSFADGQAPWRVAEKVKYELPIEASRRFLGRYQSKKPGMSLDEKEVVIGNDSGDDRSNGPLQMATTVLLKACEAPGRKPNVTAKIISRSQVIRSKARAASTPYIYVKGASSSFMWSLKENDHVRVRIEPNIDFRLPEDDTAPVIMVALGTGASPFRAFLHELIQRHGGKNRSPHFKRPWLILGVRKLSSIPFLDVLEEAYCKHKVISLTMAVSREDRELDEEESNHELRFKAGRRTRINGLLTDPAFASHFWDFVSGTAHVYACGKPDLELLLREMISSVCRSSAISSGLLSPHSSPEQIEDFCLQFPDRMAANKQLHIDTYFGGKVPDSGKQYPISEVALHNDSKSCWVIFRGNVYDLTRYISIHPGGPKILLDKGGRDMTNDFNIAHGEWNRRVASMVEPYRIGILKPFRKSSERLRVFMDEWSTPFLHNILEHRVVFLLDRNEFDDLNEPSAFVQWRSPAFTSLGRQRLVEKVWDSYEPDNFDLIDRFLDPSREGRYLQDLLECASCRSDIFQIRAEFRTIRHDVIASLPSSSSLFGEGGERPSKLLDLVSVFLEKILHMAISVQESVEKAMEISKAGLPFSDVTIVLIAYVLQDIISGAKEGYGFLAKEVLTPKGN